MKVQLANPPWSEPGLYGVRAGSRWPHFEDDSNDYMPFPFLLAYTAAVMERQGLEVDCVDALAEKLPVDGFVDRVESFDPDLLFLEVSTISLNRDLEVLAAIRRRGFDRPVAFCGLHEPMYRPDFLEQNPQLDAVLIGEYELAALDLAGAFTNGGPTAAIPGAIFRDRQGQPIDGGRRELADVDSLPWPARHLLPMDRYHDEPGSIPRLSVQMWASRGCPYGCTFCAWPQILYGSRSYRPRDPHRIADEFEALVRSWGFRSVYFDDDTFNVKRNNVLALCDEFDRRRLQVPWAAMCRADLMDEELLDRLAGCGLEAVKYGVESADQGLLDDSCKGLDLEKAVRNILLTQKKGIKTHLTFMFGLPGETRATAQKTMELALRLAPESAQFTIATPFPGSSYHRELEERGLLVHQSAEHYDGFRTAAVHTGHLGPDELEEIVGEANRRWRGVQVGRRKAEGTYPVDVSVIIPNYHQRQALVRCLRALREQTYDRFEVILVDNGSRDDSVAAAEDMIPDLTAIRIDKPLGFARAVNLGIGQARGRFVAVLNNDTEPAPGWLEAIVGAFDERPEIGFLASKVLRRDAPDVIDSFGDGLSPACFPFQIGNGVADDGGFSEPLEVLGAPACAAVYRRVLLDDVGGFDEEFGTYLEDLDLSLRAQLRGWRCLALPDARVLHAGHLTTGGVRNPEVVRLLARNWVQLLLKTVPRQALRTGALGILATGLRQMVFHTAKSRHPFAYLKGLTQGIWRTPGLVRKRKSVLGRRRADDQRLGSLLQLSAEHLHRTRKGRTAP